MSLKKEELLNIQEIHTILSIVQNNPVLSHPDILSIGVNKTDIIKVTPLTGVIIIKGNLDTGFDHVKARHDFWSTNNYWKLHDEEIRLENPSLFSRKSVPIVDYTNIVDQIFKSENLDNTKNKRPDMFDFYTAFANDENNGDQTYHLITYKNTPILHSLFPKKKDNNLTKNAHKILPFRKGNMKGAIHSNPTIITMGLPYYNNLGKSMYSFELLIFVDENKEVGIIRDLELDGHFDLYERKLPENYSFDINELEREMGTIFYSDLTPIERIIKRLHDSKEHNKNTQQNRQGGKDD